MTPQLNKFLGAKEWDYLSPQAQILVSVLVHMYNIKDLDLAVEYAVALLGDENAYELEE